MTNGWAARIDQQAAGALGQLRLMPGIEVMLHAGVVWLRGDNTELLHDHALRTLPDVHRFERLGHDELVPVGASLPTERLPEGQWHPIQHWLTVRRPITAFSGQHPAKLDVRLVRCDTPSEPNVLVSTMKLFAHYCDTASEIRLRAWMFAASTGGRVMVRGTPLPPLPGERFVATSSVAMPVGWTTQQAIDADVIRTHLNVREGGLAVIWPDGEFSHLAADLFVAATRSAVRESRRMQRIDDA